MAEYEIDDLEDAIIEDTVHCICCGASWVLGSNGDGVIIDAPDLFSGSQVKLCHGCVERVIADWREQLRAGGICEHGVNDCDYCEECHLDYIEARNNPDNL
jgi:hypothetical protein